MINLCKTLLPIDKVHATPADIGNIINLIPVIDRLLKVNVAPKLKLLSNVFSIVITVLKFLFFSIYGLYLWRM